MIIPRTLLLVAGTVVGLSGCKIAIVAPIEGRVISETGARECDPGASCMVEVVDIHFDEVFEAVPNDGFFFTEWRKAPGYFCGGNKEVCTLTTSSFEGNENLMAILESDEIFHLEPVFTAGKCTDVNDPVTGYTSNPNLVFRGEVCTTGKTLILPDGNVLEAYYRLGLHTAHRLEDGSLYLRNWIRWPERVQRRETYFQNGQLYWLQKIKSVDGDVYTYEHTLYSEDTGEVTDRYEEVIDYEALDLQV